jgi:hypothetical protein
MATAKASTASAIAMIKTSIGSMCHLNKVFYASW